MTGSLRPVVEWLACLLSILLASSQMAKRSISLTLIVRWSASLATSVVWIIASLELAVALLCLVCVSAKTTPRLLSSSVVVVLFGTSLLLVVGSRRGVWSSLASLHELEALSILHGRSILNN